MTKRTEIAITGARCHNLKNIDVSIPLNAFTVVTGVSGSGKSSLAFDTLYAEGQRRYVETFSPYTRQFLDRMDKPPVDRIDGIPPAIALSQANAIRSSRSTVGTLTELADYLKLLFARKARLVSPASGREVRPWKPDELTDHLLREFSGQSLLIGVTIPFDSRTSWKSIVSTLAAQGIVRHWFQGRLERLDDSSPASPHRIEAVLTRLKVQSGSRTRLSESIGQAFELSKEDTLWVLPDQEDDPQPLPFCSRWFCPDSGQSFSPPSPSLFTFNNPIGACPACRGFGRTVEIDYDLALPDRNLSIGEGVVKPFQTESNSACQEDLEKACRRKKIPLTKPFRDLTRTQQNFVIHGEPGKGYRNRWYGVEGFFNWLESRTYKVHVRVLLSRYRAYRECDACGGSRLQPELRHWHLEGKTLPECNQMPLSLFQQYADSLTPSDESDEILIDQLRSRARYLNQVGLGYLNLNRAARTLSGGEIQRVNLTTCLGSSLVGTLFVLDEPSIGLHPRDTTQLVHTLKELTRRGNTTVVVEHDDQFMRAADHLIEMGPRAGKGGGEVVAAGPWQTLVSGKSKNQPQGLTGAFLSGIRSIPIPPKRRPVPPHHPRIHVSGATLNNLKDTDVSLPLRRFVAVTGVSGSGKSTLLHQLVYPEIRKRLGHAVESPGRIQKIEGIESITDIHIVDQSPLAKTPRSTPAVYLGCYDEVRNLFAQTDQALRKGLRASSFSFNSGDGRCSRCQGTGFEKISMQFLSDLFVTCPICLGKRFQKHVLDIRWRERSIHEVLDMTVEDAIPFFEAGIPDSPVADWTTADQRQSKACDAIIQRVRLLQDVGLGYLKLGQPLTHLSGGEAQRLKLIGHLTSASPNRKAKLKNQNSQNDTVLILDEPTTGLHFEDIKTLLALLQRMVDEGISLFVIEHNLDLIKCADTIIDLGPEAGDQGGKVIATGTPEQITRVKSSHTGRFLKPVLSKRNPTSPHAKTPRPAARHPQEAPPSNQISVRGASHHNLKHIDVDIPREKMIVVTGLSGSGKSTLAFDLLFSEGQRRYLDCLSSYARQFIEQLEKPRVDAIHGLPPTVAIEQRTTRGGAKSTVATVTEIYHFLRLLYSKVGRQHDPETGEPAIQQSAQEITARVREQLGPSRKSKNELVLLAPLVRNRKGIYTELGRWAVRQELPFLRVDGKWVPPHEFKALDRYREHSIDAVLGNISPHNPEVEVLINRALAMGSGTLYTIDETSRETIYSTELYCPGTGRSFDPLDPRLFSYNSPYGWCPVCQGYGTPHRTIHVDPRLTGAEREAAVEAAIEELEAQPGQENESSDSGTRLCPACDGSRLQPIARAVRFRDRPVPDWNRLSVDAFDKDFAKLKWTGRDAEIARDIVPEITQRLHFLQQVGLGYLQLDRAATTLSGGESQRIRLAAQLGSNLQGVLYILDEPTIGLHPRDNEQLLQILETLKSRGNSMIVVEHDEDTMKQADQIIDLGPGAGIHGGEIVAQGHWRDLVSPRPKNTPKHKSATAHLLGHPIPHPSRGSYRPVGKGHPFLTVEGACANNLKNIDVRIPRQRLTVLSGVSGSGKSSLLHEVIRPAVTSRLKKPRHAQPATRSTYAAVHGADGFDGVLEITQSPIGKTSRSTVATYIGLMDHLRALYASLPLAKARGFNKSFFSYNAGKGRCPSCQGQGIIKVEMNFLPPAYVPCEQCQGHRWTDAVLEVEYQGLSIFDSLELSVDEAVDRFTNHPKVAVPLRLLQETGLGYLKIGQSSPTLSGGEAQRLKLVAELAGAEQSRQRHLLKSSNPKLPENLYLLEEPTVGLHLDDVRKLIDLLHRLVDADHTVIVIEHHMDVVAEADWVIDIGPESGEKGGKIVAQGTPIQVARSKRSHTAAFLREKLPSG